jgi:ATP-dependent Lhr-like helicase
MNVGTIIESAMLKVRLARSVRDKPGHGAAARRARARRVEEMFLETCPPGDTFMFAGEVLRFEMIIEDEAWSPAPRRHRPAHPLLRGRKIPALVLSRRRVRGYLADPFEWDRLPQQTVDWLLQQRRRSVLPGAATSWSRRFRAPGATTSWPFPSRGGWRTRPSACC